MTVAPLPNTLGWRAAWRRTWGPFTDGRSRLSRLAARIEAEILAEYVVGTALERRRVRQAAQLMALSEQTMARLDTDPKSTRRLAAVLARQSEMKLARLTPRATTPAGNGHGTVTVRQFGTKA